MNDQVKDKLVELISFASSHGLQEMTWQDKGMKIAFKKNGHHRAASAPVAPKVSEEPKKVVDTFVTSPLVGTFRRSVSKDRPPFVVEGEHVKPGDRLGIVECMKIPTDVTSFCLGEVIEVLVDDGAKVEYGQPLFAIKPKEEATQKDV